MKWDRFVCYFADKTKKNSILLNANCVRMPWEINIYWNSILFLLLFFNMTVTEAIQLASIHKHILYSIHNIYNIFSEESSHQYQKIDEIMIFSVQPSFASIYYILFSLLLYFCFLLFLWLLMRVIISMVNCICQMHAQTFPREIFHEIQIPQSMYTTTQTL